MTRNTLTRKRAVREDAIAVRHLHSADLEVAQSIYATHAADDFTISIATGVESDERHTYTDREAAGIALERLARHTEATAKAQRRTICRAVGEYRGFTVWLDTSPFTLRAAELWLVYAQAVYQITALERVLDTGLTARGIISSIDASLRDLQARIVRNDRLNADDTQQIAAADAERYAHLHERLDALTAELRAVTDAPATAPTPSTDTAGDTSQPVDTAAVTEAAAEIDRAFEEILPPGIAFVADDIPPALRSLALLQAPPVEPAPVVLVADAAPTRTITAPSPRLQSTPTCSTNTPAPHAPRFGDHMLLRQQCRPATSRYSQPTASAADAPTQLDLFAA